MAHVQPYLRSRRFWPDVLIQQLLTAQNTIQAILTTLSKMGTAEALQILQQWQQKHPGGWN